MFCSSISRDLAISVKRLPELLRLQDGSVSGKPSSKLALVASVIKTVVIQKTDADRL